MEDAANDCDAAVGRCRLCALLLGRSCHLFGILLNTIVDFMGFVVLFAHHFEDIRTQYRKVGIRVIPSGLNELLSVRCRISAWSSRPIDWVQGRFPRRRRHATLSFKLVDLPFNCFSRIVVVRNLVEDIGPSMDSTRPLV